MEGNLTRRVLYFAYGSNMSPNVISEVCPSFTFLGIARLDGYRIAFTRYSDNWRGGVADIIDELGMSLYGVLYEIEEKEVEDLDRKEGYGSKYTKTEVDVVLLPDLYTYAAIVYVVISKESSEISPSREYLDTMIEGAKCWGIRRKYISFLESLKLEDTNNFRAGFLVRPTDSRAEAKGMPLLKVSKSVIQSQNLDKLAVVSYRKRHCIAKVAILEELPNNRCELDQSSRQALGIPGRTCYGSSVFIHRLKGKRLTSPFIRIQPRSLVLPICRPAWLDSEKNICVLHHNNIRLLGVSEGEYVKVCVARFDNNGEYQTKECTLRVFGGSTKKINRMNEEIDYPGMGEIYLDLDGRKLLGIPKDDVGVPAVIFPSIRKLFVSRLLYYGITLFIGIVAVWTVIDEIVSIFSASSIISVISLFITILLAILITLFFIRYDIRGKIQY